MKQETEKIQEGPELGYEGPERSSSGKPIQFPKEMVDWEYSKETGDLEQDPMLRELPGEREKKGN